MSKTVTEIQNVQNSYIHYLNIQFNYCTKRNFEGIIFRNDITDFLKSKHVGCSENILKMIGYNCLKSYPGMKIVDFSEFEA